MSIIRYFILLASLSCITIGVVFLVIDYAYQPPAEVLPTPTISSPLNTPTSTSLSSDVAVHPCAVDKRKTARLIPDGDSQQILHIAHTLGLTPDGTSGTNTKEAFVHSYSKGFRLFEADFLWTKDSHILVAHDGHESFWGINGPFDSMEYADIMPATYLNTYTPMDLAEFLQLLSTYPDTYVILDIKFDTGARYDLVLAAIIEEAIRTLGPTETFTRLIPQIYEREDIERNPILCNFTDILFTQYRNNLPWSEVLAFLRLYPGITAVATPYPQRFSPSYVTDLTQLRRGLYVHPVHDTSLQDTLIAQGIGVFSTVSTTIQTSSTFSDIYE